MLFKIRRVARPLGLVAILVFVAPGAVVDCLQVSAVTGEAMACCKPGDGVGLKADCCTVSDGPSSPDRQAGTSASVRPASDALPVSAGALPLAGPALMPASGVIDPLDTGPPPDRLYIRFAAIRR